MPTANQHYKTAEHFMDVSVKVFDPDFAVETLSGVPEGPRVLVSKWLVAAAQVHATLALAATNGADKPTTSVRVGPGPTTGPTHGDEITDQMGGTPDVIDPTDCWRDGCVSDNHDSLGPHVDAEGVEFR